MMFKPGAWCFPDPAPFVQSCCTLGFACLKDTGSLFGHSCQQLQDSKLNYTFASSYGECKNKVAPGDQCGARRAARGGVAAGASGGAWYRRGGGGRAPQRLPAGVVGCGGGGQCIKWNTCANTGPWVNFCCPDGFSCQPGSQDYRVWTCSADVTAGPPVDDAAELLQYPPRKLPEGSCTCRTDANEERVPTACPSPWSTPAGTDQVATPIKVGKKGRFYSTETGQDVVLHGVNWYGWSVGQFNFDGLWAFCDDNFTASTPPCQQDGEIPPHYPYPAIGAAGIQRLGGIRFWGKRTMTNDFATVIYRMKLLGFNSVRIPFSFADLNKDIPPPSTGKTEFFPCMIDPDSTIAWGKTIDPALAKLVADQGLTGKFDFPRYTGPQHPPPKVKGSPQCNLPWSAPFTPSYRGGQGQLNLTMCNWYLPQGPNVPAIQRLLWQVQYVVSQGMYAVLTFSSARDPEPNVASPQLFTRNWQNLWRMLADLPQYKHMKGRVLADLATDPSRWGCQVREFARAAGAPAGSQWDKTCAPAGASGPACAPGAWLYASAASAIHAVDGDVPVLIEGMGQDQQRGKFASCASGYFPGLKWGDGFITNGPTVSRYNLSNPSGMFAYEEFKKIGPFAINKAAMPNQASAGRHNTPAASPLCTAPAETCPRASVVVSPHLYPASITGVPAETEDQDDEITWKWDISWGWKSLGLDKTSKGEALRDVGLLIGEFGAADGGDNGVANADTTSYSARDAKWLKLLSRYLNGLSWQNGPASWMWWSWNANSGDTKGIVGPLTTWREVQWTKIRMLTREFGLVPWYCKYVSSEFCETVTWQ
ncbi:hypothetical protein MNEG_3478 [Monoraphidium neglectum]|uniref:Uncharacterized protein n=1 Tax=Monoraphidium neglectum TaxID=145388 RepID=A0A0D2MVD9_9CHLO|nr:hypothetical protein MNEG_3478 [Monoraphidium neglectum]KIZ04477.1 hypothetical protein MNEG_3478 [Monoraphidium neglectum]|eukprot:XP_013903496.1 hypothetical protein MNEG_3478 [Monoraphidium neglectum]